MANMKISELNSLTEKDYTDVLPIVDTSANETKKISIEKLIDNNVKLLDVTDTAPSECSVGDKYYNTEDNRIYTATATDTWSESGEEPIEGIFYIVFEKQSTYAYDGETLVSVGGGAGGGSVPIGTITPYAGNTAPEDSYICDGSEKSRIEDADLFAVIGTTYGAGDGSTTFNLPNLKGRVLVGLDGTQTEFDTLGETGGSKYIQEHSHKFGVNASFGGTSSSGGYMGGSAGYTSGLVGDVDGVTTGNSGNLQPYIVVNYIIKAKKITPTEAQVVNTNSDSTEDTYSCDYVNKANTYSTNEVKTNKTWTTGIPIYRKVINFTLSNTTGAFQNIAHNIQNLGAYRRIVYFAYMYEGSSTYPVPNDAITEIGFTDNYITYYNTNSYITGAYAYVILEYTKTTD